MPDSDKENNKGASNNQVNGTKDNTNSMMADESESQEIRKWNATTCHAEPQKHIITSDGSSCPDNKTLLP